ncbi:MAG: hypothetical protein HY645_09550 [Acidobacteria bacterium]|nr:hypothetical protein [Acidobacteriota bacterium]
MVCGAQRIVALISFLLASGSTLAQEYNPKGKRDPFLNLHEITRQETPRIVEPPPLEKRPTGLNGLLISEVAVSGLASNSAATLVILKGLDKFTYFARVGTKLYDGYLESISPTRVVFIREVSDTRGNKQRSRVIKRLYSEDHQGKTDELP